MPRKPCCCCSPDSDRHKKNLKVGSGPASKHCRSATLQYGTVFTNVTRTKKCLHQCVTSIISSVSRLYFLTSTSSPVLIIISRTRSIAATWFKNMGFATSRSSSRHKDKEANSSAVDPDLKRLA
jgi:hypothetical protein